MEKISVISNPDKIHSSLPLRPIRTSFHKVTPINPFKENLKKTLSLDQCWTEDCFLSPDDFRIQLRKEKRRVDRSSAPLSIALFELNEPVLNNEFELKKFFDCLRTKTRETDIKGWVNSKTIGVILLDTNEAGLNCYVESIIKENGNRFLPVVKGSYPDSIFEKILEESKAAPDLFPFDLDHVSEDRPVQRFFKRCLDIFGSVIGLVLFSPLMALTAMAIKITSPGPVIFKQFRIGCQGSRFHFCKFRSMRVNNDDRVHREYLARLIEGKHGDINNGDGDQPFFKIKNDNRITPVGRIIRKLSLDELPQFFNVLKGEMSLVGPRPPIPYEIENYKPWHLRRILEIKPGITGLWQVEGRSQTSFDEMVRLDLRYVKDWSIWLDIKILLKTVKAVLVAKGAA
jgi:lipopolysaccharide/colanic/teichoic acid biosynthesis glycosyltransferase